jgi:hypothetical protein
VPTPPRSPREAARAAQGEEQAEEQAQDGGQQPEVVRVEVDVDEPEELGQGARP